MVCSEAVSELMSQGEDGLVDRPLLAIIQQSDEPRVLPRPTQGPQAGQAGGAVVEIPGKQNLMVRSKETTVATLRHWKTKFKIQSNSTSNKLDSH